MNTIRLTIICNMSMHTMQYTPSVQVFNIAGVLITCTFMLSLCSTVSSAMWLLGSTFNLFLGCAVVVLHNLHAMSILYDSTELANCICIDRSTHASQAQVTHKSGYKWVN